MKTTLLATAVLAFDYLISLPAIYWIEYMSDLVPLTDIYILTID
jgi:hypothetical protein